VTEDALAAAARIAELTGVERHDVALVLGSGWRGTADVLGTTRAELSVDELPGFVPHGVGDHSGRLRSVEAGTCRVLVLVGRTHLYEGHGVAAVVHPIRAAVAAGCSTIVLTNACGGIHERYAVGQPVLIRDHVNLTGATPLVGPRFVDLTDLYSPRLRALCRELDPTLEEGVYVGFAGPQFETPAEIVMARAIGGDLVGMSTVLEAIAARVEGAEVLGISLVANPAAGVGDTPIDHEDVLAAGRAATGRLGSLLARLLARA
jgi:purine-nucleoside phosphorylase